MTKDIIWIKQFKKDYKTAMKRGYNIEHIDKVITLLATTETLPPEYKDHNLTGNYKGFRECHIENDWLLIYAIQEEKLVLILSRTGTHSDLF